MFDVDLLINNADAKAAGGATFDRLNPMTGEVASRAAAASAEDAVRAVDAAAAAFPAWSEMAPAARRALLNKAADLLEAARPASSRPMMARRDRLDRHVGRLQLHAGRRHAARGRRHDHADLGRDHPLQRAGQPRHGLPPAGRRGGRHRAVERAGHPGRARHRHAARLRQHGGAQGLRDVPRHAPPDRRRLPRGGPARRASSTSSPTRPRTPAPWSMR